MIFSVRPVFIGWITLLYQLPLQLFFTIWAGGFLGGMLRSFHFASGNSWAPFVFFRALAFFGIPLVAYVGKKLNYSRTEYRFFPEKLEFEEGFFTINQKVIKFKDVREVTLRKGIFQRMYGLGSIYLATLATGSSPGYAGYNVFGALGFGNISASGVTVRDIQNPDEIFAKVRSMVDARNQ
jgi:membrane protein YdbS with pleckstrin-like domain